MASLIFLQKLFIFKYIPYIFQHSHRSVLTSKFSIPEVISQNVTKKVDWYVSKAKNMHPWSPSDPWVP